MHVNIGEAKTRLSELVAAAVRGQDIVLDKAGEPQVRLVPVAASQAADHGVIAARRAAAFGMWKDAFHGFDTSLSALKADHADPDARFGRLLGPAD
jgi:prevent-host-death family protein